MNSAISNRPILNLRSIFISQNAVNVTVVVTPDETVAVLLLVVCPVFATVIV